MNKAYARVIWVNYPATDTPINETNLNRMDLALDTIDDRVITLDTTKANESDLLTCVASISFNPTTGIMTITQKNGTVGTIDTGLSKLAVNFDYDDDPTSPHYQQIILEMKDGTYKYIDLSALITQYEFSNTSTIAFTVGTGGVISASVVDGSITADKLQPNYLADIILQVGYAESAATSASADATLAESYAVGGTGTRTGEDTDNAKYYKEQAAAIAGGNYVSYDPQPLTDSQKAQARSNISAASVEELSHKNLLDNPFFTVNQRGQSTYSSTGYCVDRWLAFTASSNAITMGSVTVNDVAWVRQTFDEHLPSGKYVASMELDGDIVSLDIDYTNNGQRKNYGKEVAPNVRLDMTFYDVNSPQNKDSLYISFLGNNENHTVKAIKFELGEVSTLANDVAPDYTTELLKCKRYFQRMQGKMYGTPRWLHFGMGAVMSATSANIALPIPTEFRAVPTISFYNGSHGFRLTQGSNIFATVTGMNIDTCTTSYVNIDVTCPSQTAVPVDSFCRLWSANSDSYIDLSADL